MPVFRGVVSILLLFWHSLLCSTTFAQVNIGGLGAPDSSAVLELESNNKGFLPPRLSTQQRNNISNPANGLQVFNTTTNCLEQAVAGFWQKIHCACLSAPAAPSIISGDSLVCADKNGLLFGLNGDSGVVYHWTVPPGWLLEAGQYGSMVSVKSGQQSGNITVVAQNDCGISQPASKLVQITGLPQQPSVILGNDSLCPNAPGQWLKVSPVPGIQYQWSLPAGFSISGGQGTDSIQFQSGILGGTASVVPVNNCGTGPAQFLPLVVLPFQATGGQVSTVGAYTLHTFVNSGTFSILQHCNDTIEVLAVGGGGGGGGPDGSSGAGGGGGGAVVSAFLAQTGNYNVFVGGGGAGGVGCNAAGPGGAGGSNGGGAGGNAGSSGCSGGGGGGGGWTGIALSNTYLVVAGGGAGGGGSNEGTANDVASPGGGSQTAANGNNMQGGAGQSYSGDGGGGGGGGGGLPGGQGQTNLNGNGQSNGGQHFANGSNFGTSFYSGNPGASQPAGAAGGTAVTVPGAAIFGYTNNRGAGGSGAAGSTTGITAPSGQPGILIVRYKTP